MHRLELLQCHSHQSHILQVVCSYYGRLAHAHHMLHIPWPAPDVDGGTDKVEWDTVTSRQVSNRVFSVCVSVREIEISRSY